MVTAAPQGEEDRFWLSDRAAAVTDAEWQRTADLANRYLTRFGTVARDGRPWHCARPAPVSRTDS